MSPTPQSLGRPLHLALVACNECGSWSCPAKWGTEECTAPEPSVSAARPRTTKEAA